ncbi:hypothetical protein AAVH_19981 [Aphelenchoides avenae]|nr:hypothetical protein AAVH_19981 [Aphelenchus avenae]
MSSKLSAAAQLQVLRLLAGGDDYAWFSRVRWTLSTSWKVLDHLYFGNLAAPPESYLRSRELAMIQKDAVTEEDLSFIFSHREPLVFHACPNSLVPKLVNAFQELREEPSFLHATIACDHAGRIEVSPPLYVDCFPCTACRHDATVQTRFRRAMANARDSNKERVVEKFHICSEHFTKQLSIELYYSTTRQFYGNEFYARPETASGHAYQIRVAY